MHILQVYNLTCTKKVFSQSTFEPSLRLGCVLHLCGYDLNAIKRPLGIELG